MNSADIFTKSLVQRELGSIILLKEYIQFNFDGSIFNFYDLPKLRIDSRWLSPLEPGYFDCIKNFIGLKVTSFEETPGISLSLIFDNDYSVLLSLKAEDRSSAEVAMLQAERGERWTVW